MSVEQNNLEITGLSKGYSGFRLNNVSFSVPQGCIMGLIGENGAGKTTTLKLILNLIRRDAGSIKIFGKDNIKEERAIKEQLGVVLDESCFHETLTAPNISVIMGKIYKGSWDNGLYESYIHKFALPKDKTVKEYSRGMKMKLSIAAALAHHPRFLILDEATSGLDPVVRSEILDVFFDFIQDEQHSILMSSHITSDLEKVADYITFIHKGEIVLSEAKDTLLENHGVIKCGAGDLERLDKRDIVSVRNNGFSCEALTANKAEVQRKYRGLTVDNATLEDIMLFYVRGDR